MYGVIKSCVHDISIPLPKLVSAKKDNMKVSFRISDLVETYACQNANANAMIS